MAKSIINDNNNFITLIGSNKVEIDKIMDQLKPEKELEFIFFSNKNEYMNKEKYMYFVKYMSNMDTNGEYKLEHSQETLDINLSLSETETLRITVKKNENENNLSKVYNNLIERVNNYSTLRMALYLARKSKDRNNFDIIIKKRSFENIYDINEFNIRCKLSDEKDIFNDVISGKNLHPLIEKLLNDSDKIPIEERKEINKKVVFRFKERLTMIYDKAKDYVVKLDLTFVRFSKNLKKINNEIPNYELELEIQGNKMNPLLKKQIYDRLESIVELIQKSNFIVSNGMKNKIINYYKHLVIGNDNAKITSLVGRQPVSLEVQHVTTILPDKYAVTDKADGDRAILIIYESQVYLIYNDLTVRDTGIVLSSSFEKYNGTIADGEFIYCEDYDRQLFMIFDCLFFGEKDIRGEENIIKRLNHIDKIINECFTEKTDKGFTERPDNIPKMNSFDLDKVTDFHKSEIKRYYKNIIEDVSKWSIYPLIRRKYFIPVTGAMKWEIFKYSLAFWKLYTEDSDVKLPYHLDGLIYHPLYQIYTTDKQKSKYEEYKWKPPSHNSIDFYVEFQKDPLTRKDLIIYDNTNKIKNKPYKICNLYVGKITDNQEYPIPFTLNDGYSETYLFLKDNDKEVRDQDGDIILGGTVVEFYYNNDQSIPPTQRWVPMRTRHDKTTFVERYKRKYGNYFSVAEKVWRSIMNPVKMSDFKDLSVGGSKYHDKIQKLNMTIGRDIVLSTEKEKNYYASYNYAKKLSTSMRAWHNIMKSIIMYTHCHHMYRFGVPQSVLDFGCGEGGDILKHYYSEISFCVGIEYNLNNLLSPVDGALSRYNQMRKGKANFPKMYWINADLRVLLNVEDQTKALGGMTSENQSLLNKFFPKNGNINTFDIINCQFCIHYFLENKEAWTNFKQNVKSSLNAGGTFIVTTFSGDVVRQILKDKEKFTEYYTNERGEKKILFDIIKFYDDENFKSGLGNKIDYHGAWMFNEGQYESEYLVDKDFLVDELKKDCDLELIDTDLFENQFNLNKDFFTNYAKYLANPKTRSSLLNAGTYYEDTDINISLRKFTNLHTYYVFRKKGVSQNKNKNINIKGGNKYDLLDRNQFGTLMTENKSKNTFIKSINKILTQDKIIPNINHKVMCKELGIKNIKDSDVDDKNIKRISKKLVVSHEMDDPNNLDKTINETALNGLNIIVVSPDCNNHYDIKYTNINNVNKFGVLIMEDDKYYPIYQKNNNKSIFNADDGVIKYLIKNGENI
jgi:hypothetical protein